MKEQERRLASVYIGAVGAEIEIGACSDSIRNLNIRRGDYHPPTIRATKGYEARQAHIETFLKMKHLGAILLLDADMQFEPDTLERLRSHGNPYVSGFYMRRMHSPILPVMYEFTDGWPMRPVTRDIQEMDIIGGNGWGCVLVHREVFEAVEPLLKGEDFVLEDDMDVWPYDLPKMIRAINKLDKWTEQGDIEKARILAKFLKSEFRPLRGQKDIVGSDLRFPYYASKVGYPLYIDPTIRPKHNLNYGLSPDDYKVSRGMQADTVKGLDERIKTEQKKWQERMDKLV